VGQRDVLLTFRKFPLPLGSIRIPKMQAASFTETSSTLPTATRLYQFCLKHVLLRQTSRDLRARSMQKRVSCLHYNRAVLNDSNGNSDEFNICGSEHHAL
jgi:hypothetical protein